MTEYSCADRLGCTICMSLSSLMLSKARAISALTIKGCVANDRKEQ